MGGEGQLEEDENPTTAEKNAEKVWKTMSWATKDGNEMAHYDRWRCGQER